MQPANGDRSDVEQRVVEPEVLDVWRQKEPPAWWEQQIRQRKRAEQGQVLYVHRFKEVGSV